MKTVAEWRAFLQKWSDEWLATEEPFPPAVRKSRWLGYKPTTERRVQQLERRLGYELPPSFRAFLLTTDGWRRTSMFIERLRPVRAIEWLEVDDPQHVDICGSTEEEDVERLDGLPPEEYFAYDGRPIYDAWHFRKSLKIADPIDGDSMIYVLNPQVVAEDGEWEAWTHANWIPGAVRYPSFAHLMRAEYESFRAVTLKQGEPVQVAGPFAGVYAPDRPRRAATRIGPGRRAPRRLTVPELIGNLENPSPGVRLAAAKQLFRAFKPHQPEEEQPQLVAPLARILRSGAEGDVRGAAACMLGSYGDQGAIAPLVAALEDPDPEAASAAVSALHYLSLYMKDGRIADGLCCYLAAPRDYSSTATAMHILEDSRDVRLATIALRLLDSDVNIQLRYQAAFAVAKTSKSAADELVMRLTSANPELRAAAAAALRATHDQRALEPLTAAARDPDTQVRQQAEISLRALREEAAHPRVEETQPPVDAEPVTVYVAAPKHRKKSLAGVAICDAGDLGWLVMFYSSVGRQAAPYGAQAFPTREEAFAHANALLKITTADWSEVREDAIGQFLIDQATKR